MPILGSTFFAIWREKRRERGDDPERGTSNEGGREQMVRWEDPLLARCIPAIADRAGRRAAQKLQSEYIGCRCDGECTAMKRRGQ